MLFSFVSTIYGRKVTIMYNIYIECIAMTSSVASFRGEVFSDSYKCGEYSLLIKKNGSNCFSFKLAGELDQDYIGSLILAKAKPYTCVLFQ